MTAPFFVASLDRGAIIVLIVCAILAMIVMIVTAIVRRARAATAGWTALQAQVGLRKIGPHEWAGEVDGFSLSIVSVRIKPHDRMHYEMHARIGGLPDAVHLGAVGSRAITDIAGPVIETGDPDFDKAVEVRGDEGQALALLDAEAREDLGALIDDYWYIVGGELCRSPGLVAATHSQVLWGLHVARLVRAKSGSVDERLMRQVYDDPLPSVRGRALEVLVARGHHDLTWLFGLTGEKHPAAVRVVALGAITTLVAEHDHDHRARALDLAVRWIRVRSTAMRCAGLRAVTRFALASLRPGFAQLAPPGAEDTLLAVIHDDTPAVQHEAVAGLAAIGTVRAVPALMRLAERLIGSPLTRAAEAAIVAIQARVGDVVRGGLTVVADDHGALALGSESPRERGPEVDLRHAPDDAGHEA